MLASRHHGNTARLDEFLAGRVVAKMMNFGSSLKFCRLAERIEQLRRRHDLPQRGRTAQSDGGTHGLGLAHDWPVRRVRAEGRMSPPPCRGGYRPNLAADVGRPLNHPPNRRGPTGTGRDAPVMATYRRAGRDGSQAARRSAIASCVASTA